MIEQFYNISTIHRQKLHQQIYYFAASVAWIISLVTLFFDIDSGTTKNIQYALSLLFLITSILGEFFKINYYKWATILYATFYLSFSLFSNDSIFNHDILWIIVAPALTVLFINKYSAYTIMFIYCSLITWHGIQYMQPQHRIYYITIITVMVSLTVILSIVQNMLSRYVDIIQDQMQMQYKDSKLKTLGEISSQFSHDVSNPIQSMMANLYLLNDIIDKNNLSSDHKAKQLSKRLELNLNRLQNMSKAILNYLRDSSEIMYSNILADKLQSQLDILLEGRMNNTKIKVDYDIEKSARVFYFHEDTLIQVMHTLIHNALDEYKGQNDPQIKVKFRRVDSKIYISVTDNLGNIPKENREEIFKPFFFNQETSWKWCRPLLCETIGN